MISMASNKKTGIVYLVGAGPGDPGLLTLRGAELLRRADVVVYDALVNPDLLSLAPCSAEVIFGGKRAGDKPERQTELNKLLISKARSGMTVVRLKGGDPYVFGRGGEEAEELADAGIPFEVVPGVSSFVAVPNYAGIPLTHRGMASRLTLITGHGDPSIEPGIIDWPQVAKTPGTKVIMMGTERIAQISQQLIAHGMSRETPVAMVRWGTTCRQQSIQGTLGNIGEIAEREKLCPPTVAVIGEVVTLRDKLNWFEKRPLFGRRVVVTRSREQASQVTGRLRDLGADVLEIPTIRFETPTRREHIVDALLDLHAYDWLVFTSANGVRMFFEYFFRRFKDLRDIGGVRIAAVGPGTAAELQQLHLQVDVMPDDALGKCIVGALAKFESIENLRICLLRAEVANPELPRALEAMGAIVDDIGVYRTVAEQDEAGPASVSFSEAGADWVLFTSGSTVEHFHTRFNLPKVAGDFPQLKLASIGPETTKALAALALKPVIEAGKHTLDGLIEALLERERK